MPYNFIQHYGAYLVQFSSPSHTNSTHNGFAVLQSLVEDGQGVNHHFVTSASFRLEPDSII